MADHKHRKPDRDSRKRRSPSEDIEVERHKRRHHHDEDRSHRKSNHERSHKDHDSHDKDKDRKRRKNSDSDDIDYKSKQKHDKYDKNRDNNKERDNDRGNRKKEETSGWDDERPRNVKKEHKRREWDKGKYGADEEEDQCQFGDKSDDKEKKETINKEEPDFGLSGKLTEYTNTYNGVVIKYNEPTEARKPKTKWRLYPFKGDTALPMLKLHRQSAFLLGRDRKIADIPVDHPSCSSQHAVLQFRLVKHEKADGEVGKKVKPYMIDLESTNGTFVNNQKIEPRRYTELLEKDVLKFGFSSREYVILHEKTQGEEEDDDEKESDKEEEKEEEEGKD